MAIHHLSHQDVAQWIEKTNRYTSRLDRERVTDYGQSLSRFAHDRIDHWLSRTRGVLPGGYPEAVAVLRATYDLIDRLKTWEEERALDCAAEFQRICAALDAEYLALGVVRSRVGEAVKMVPNLAKPRDEDDILQQRLAEFRAHHDALTAERDAQAAETARLAGDLASLGRLQDETRLVLAAEKTRAELAEAEWARVQAESIAQRQRAEQAEALVNRLQDDHHLLRGKHELLQGEHELLLSQHATLRGSLRTFLRGYLPLLRRHLFGQRP